MVKFEEVDQGAVIGIQHLQAPPRNHPNQNKITKKNTEESKPKGENSEIYSQAHSLK